MQGRDSKLVDMNKNSKKLVEQSRNYFKGRALKERASKSGAPGARSIFQEPRWSAFLLNLRSALLKNYEKFSTRFNV